MSENQACCPICDASVAFQAEFVAGELIECMDCGTELEIAGLNPFLLEEAPQVDEDWGE